MTFGLIKWLISFVIFLTVLIIISWSAVHLGTKDKNATDIVLRFLDMDNYPIEKKNLSDHSLMTQVTGSTDGSIIYTDNQGFEVKDRAEFYKILKALRPTNNNSFALNNYQNISKEIINISNHTANNNNNTWSKFEYE